MNSILKLRLVSFNFIKEGINVREIAQANTTDDITEIDKSEKSCPVISERKKKGVTMKRRL